MKNSIPSWFGLFKSSYIENYILLVIESYQSISAESRSITKKEEDRRTEQVEIMRCKKNEYNICFPIAYESGEKTKRMDICCYIDNMNEDSYICFECKRFIKSNITKSNFEKEYYGEGIKRFENNEYSRHMNEAGMIAFLETGDMGKLKGLFEKELPEKSINKVIEDCSLQFCFQYVFRSVHNRVENGHELSLHHILLDLTKNRS